MNFEYYEDYDERNEDKVLYGDSQSHLQQYLLGNAEEDEESYREINQFYSIEHFVNLTEYRANQVVSWNLSSSAVL